MPSLEGPRLVRGGAQYLANMKVAGSLHAAFLRSPHAHARIASIDVSRARAMPGVHSVLTGEDLAQGTEPIMASDVLHFSSALAADAKLPHFYALSADEVNFVGDPVAMVIAESRHLAEDALEEIEVDYEALPAVVDPGMALSPESPTAFSDWPDNLGFHMHTATGEVDQGLATAERVVRHRFSMHRSGYPPLEPMVAVADWHEADGLTLWLTTQKVHVTRVAMADILRLPAARVRVIAPQDIGGAFGWKAQVYREPFAVAFASMQLGRPVTWIQDRNEALMAGGHERDGAAELEGGFDADGRLRALRIHLLHDSGCAKVDQYQYVGALVSAYVPPPYVMDAYEVQVECAVTNKAPVVVNRAAGRLPIVFAIERFMDQAARELGIDGVEIRRRNLPPSHPYPAPGGATHEGDFLGVLATLVERMDYANLQRQAAEARASGRHVGVGVSVALDLASPIPSAAGVQNYNQPLYASARVRMEVDGGVVVYAGDSPQGQHRETTVAQVAADVLGVDPRHVVVRFGDTATSPFNNHGAHTQTAVHIAATRVREKVLRIGACMLGADPDECELVAGAVQCSSEPSRNIPVEKIARAAYLNPGVLPSGMDPMLDETAVHEIGLRATNSFSAHGCLVEVDPDTAVFTILDWWYVGDAGRPLNPLLLEGAIHGGISTGVSNAAYEHYAYDGDGQFLAGTMMDYLMPGPMEIPKSKVYHYDSPTDLSVLGYKKMVSEGTPAGVAPALVQAVESALEPFGMTLHALPLTPSRIWDAMRTAKPAPLESAKS